MISNALNPLFMAGALSKTGWRRFKGLQCQQIFISPLLTPYSTCAAWRRDLREDAEPSDDLSCHKQHGGQESANLLLN